MTRRATEAERDARDLAALRLRDKGLSQHRICDRLGMSRGPFVKLLKEIREDEAGGAGS